MTYIVTNCKLANNADCKKPKFSLHGTYVNTAVCHPGVVLARQLEATGVSPTELARQLDVPANRFTQIINGKRRITGDSALRLAHWFGTEPAFWLNLQTEYDLELAETEVGAAIGSLPRGLALRDQRK
ncbi:HigA family addiction module antitoxin [Limnobacter sp. CACIAM 66H1]|uniref:HigA family addiction module antitoxin n=1 Tax=Limnobacter sp. CACIAM 66H1 TaxID=1813033 RepID=UPI0025B89302|nr:HigA family addiction module antitoxin [Limnobacter sp. CACIAM 66H1]